MSKNSREIIREYLLEGDSQEKEEKFEIAWEIWENFKDIIEDSEKDILEIILSNISIPSDFKAKTEETELNVYRDKWKKNGEPFFWISLSFWGNFIYLGIRRKGVADKDIEEIRDVLKSKGFLVKRSEYADSWVFGDGKFLAIIPIEEFRQKSVKEQKAMTVLEKEKVADFLGKYLDDVFKTKLTSNITDELKNIISQL